MCSTHYGRWQTRSGDTSDPVRPSQEARFLSLVDQSGANGCWVWQGRTWKGYGSFSIQRSPAHQGTVGAHRWAYEHWVGPIPTGLIVCHTCDNPPCVNPAHLFVGTHQDNARDREQKGRGGALRGSQQKGAVLDEELVLLIRRLHIPGKVGALTISQLLDVPFGTVQGVLSGYTWRHIQLSTDLQAS